MMMMLMVVVVFNHRINVIFDNGGDKDDDNDIADDDGVDGDSGGLSQRAEHFVAVFEGSPWLEKTLASSSLLLALEHQV